MRGRQVVFYLKYIRSITSFKPRHYARAITGDYSVELNETTLTGRLLNYLDSTKNVPSKINYDIETTDILKSVARNNLGRFNLENILYIFNNITNNGYSQKKFLTALTLLDNELCTRLDRLDTAETIYVLHAYMKVIPHIIVQYEFYEKAMEKLYSSLNSLSRNDLVQFIFYLGLQKKSNTRSQYMLRKCMNKFDNEELVNELSTEALCIICNATFKSGTKITNTLFLSKIVTYIYSNLNILNDPALFTTLIKTIRHNRYQNEELLTTITCTIFFNKLIDCYTFPALCHILALYSDYLYYDDYLVEAFTKKSIELLRSCREYKSKREYVLEPRVKDIKRFLWCLSNLNYKNIARDDIKQVIKPTIIRRIENGEFQHDFTSATEIILYLWMLNYRSFEIISRVLTRENVENMKELFTPAKHRLNLLLTCIYFEDRGLYNKLNIHPQSNTEYDANQQIEKRVVLQRVFNTLKLISKFEINKYVLNCQVPYLNLVGITGYRKKIYKAVHVELLDDYTCLKNTDGTPSGLMQLKLRIMEQFDEGIIVIKASEVESMSDEELSNHLEDELDLVC